MSLEAKASAIALALMIVFIASLRSCALEDSRLRCIGASNHPELCK